MDAEPPDCPIAEVAARLGEPGLTVVDVNHVVQYARAHVPGARQLDAARFLAADLPADRHAPLIFYCYGPG